MHFESILLKPLEYPELPCVLFCSSPLAYHRRLETSLHPMQVKQREMGKRILHRLTNRWARGSGWSVVDLLSLPLGASSLAARR